MNHVWFSEIEKIYAANEEMVQLALKKLSQFTAGKNLWSIVNSYIITQILSSEFDDVVTQKTFNILD